MTPDLDRLTQWIGRTETDLDYVTVPLVERMAATLDLEFARRKASRCRWAGTALFPRVVRQSQSRPGRASGARGLPSAGATAAPHVRRPARDLSAPLLVGEKVHARIANESRSRRVAPARWCSSPSTRYLQPARPRDRRRAGHRLSRRAGSERTEASAATRARNSGGRKAVHARARRAVPLFGSNVQRPPHSLRSSLCHEKSKATKAWCRTAGSRRCWSRSSRAENPSGRSRR